jgi:hypothetical protein
MPGKGRKGGSFYNRYKRICTVWLYTQPRMIYMLMDMSHAHIRDDVVEAVARRSADCHGLHCPVCYC